jgi:Zn-dependent M28 family amino/carboxypeptidase
LDIGCFGNYPRAALPMLSIAREDALFLRRLSARGPVKLSLRMDNTLDTSPATERNVIAELRGSSMPDHMILVGGHFDSWDTATGANDDGSGVAAVVEAARILQSLGFRGRRTIRFAFFTGEEQAILGSHAYVESHESELDRVDAVAIMDEGAGAPRGFRLHGRTDLESALRRILEPLSPLDATGLSQEASFDQDHAYFLAAGVPALSLWVYPGEYDTHHHAITDTIDKIDRRTLATDTAVMAAAIVALADAESIGRRLMPAERTELLKRTRLADSIAILNEPIRSATQR